MKQIFLLGGYDLEMLTIRDILDELHETYLDKQLRWDNALLDAYAEELVQSRNQPDIQLYGIELRTTTATGLYTNYMLIDHHNDLAARPASLIQIAQLLNYPLTHYRQLVAANDSNYIPGMEQLNATPQEINEIRQKDREAQGVTEKDEQYAEYAINNQRIQVGKITIVRSETSRFSPICDRLYPFNHLLIYTTKEWMYYGTGVEQIKQVFQKEISTGKFFFGGRQNGFCGIPSGAFPPMEIEQMKRQIIETINKQ